MILHVFPVFFGICFIFVNKWCDVLKELVRTQLFGGWAYPRIRPAHWKKDDEVWELHAKNNPGKILSVSQHEPLINYISKWWLISVRLHPHLKRMILNSRHTISVVELLPRKKGVFIWLPNVSASAFSDCVVASSDFMRCKHFDSFPPEHSSTCAFSQREQCICWTPPGSPAVPYRHESEIRQASPLLCFCHLFP